jgi:hypothetical protein
MPMPKQPLVEVFGFPADNMSSQAERYRKNKLCPYNNKVPSCTKDSVKDPLGVCSVWEGDKVAITCPVRFRQNWTIIEDAANFFFPTGASWTSIQEIRLNDASGSSAGNIDFVLVAYDEKGKLIDFGSLEVQAVYISGNVRRPFQFYMQQRLLNQEIVWTETKVRPDYLSSSRKRLVPQMIYKGSIVKGWGKKQGVVLHKTFFETLAPLPFAPAQDADIAWFVYDLALDEAGNGYTLFHQETVYTLFEPALDKITTPLPGSLDTFVNLLQEKLDEKLEDNHAPTAFSLTDVLSEG